MAKKMKRGRPKLRRNAETVSVTFCATKAAKKRMKARAKKVDMSLSEWLRHVTEAEL